MFTNKLAEQKRPNRKRYATVSCFSVMSDQIKHSDKNAHFTRLLYGNRNFGRFLPVTNKLIDYANN
jgi:hypothetical protein